MSDPLIDTTILDGGRGKAQAQWLGAGQVRFEYIGTPRPGLTLVWRLHGENGIAEARLPVTHGSSSWVVTFPEDFSGEPNALNPGSDEPASYMVEWLLFSDLDPDQGRRELGLTRIEVTDPWQ